MDIKSKFVLEMDYQKEQLSPATKLQIIADLVGGIDVLDEDGNPTGEKTPSFLSLEEAKKLLKIK